MIVNCIYFCVCELVIFFVYIGSVSVREMDILFGEIFDLIVNVMFSGIDGDVLVILVFIVNVDVYCYDMFYQKGLILFFYWCQ